MIRKRDNLNEQKYCYGIHHCPLTSASIISLVLSLAVLIPLMFQRCISINQEERGRGYPGVVWQGGVSVLLDGRIPEHSFLCRVRGRTDFFGPAAFPPAWEDWCTFLLALASLLVLLLISVRRRRRSLQISLQVWVLSGADFFAECALPLNLFQHGGVSTDPWHLGHLSEKDIGISEYSQTSKILMLPYLG